MSKRKTKKQNSEIVYQNKDIFSKCRAEQFRNKSFSAYGLKLPQIVSVSPTNLPAIEANELRMDNLFHLADGSVMIVDYESSYADQAKLKYLNYIIRTLKRYFRKKKKNPRLRMLVIYTADVERGSTNPELDTGCLQFKIEEAFLSDLSSAVIENDIRQKIETHTALSQEDQMRFMILPLTHKGNEAKRECIRRCFELIKRLDDSELQIFLISNILVFTDKVIGEADSNAMKEWMQMTKVERLYYEEKLQAVKESRDSIVTAFLKNGASDELILKSVNSLTRKELKKLKAAL